MNLHYTRLNLEFSVEEAESIRNELRMLFKDKGLSQEDISRYTTLYKFCDKTFGIWSGWDSVCAHVSGGKR